MIGERLQLPGEGGAGQAGDVEGEYPVALNLALLPLDRRLYRNGETALGLLPESLRGKAGFDPEAEQSIPIAALYSAFRGRAFLPVGGLKNPFRRLPRACVAAS